MKNDWLLNNGMLIALCILFSGCASVQRVQWTKTTEQLETPHTILRAGRSPEIVSINGEAIEPDTVSTRSKDFMTTGEITYNIRIPIGECHVKAYFPENNNGGAIGGYMAAKQRQDAPVYTFTAKSGVIYRAIADAPIPKFAFQKMFRKLPKVQIVEENSGIIVTPTISATP